jgi:hypothetical protein
MSVARDLQRLEVPHRRELEHARPLQTTAPRITLLARASTVLTRKKTRGNFARDFLPRVGAEVTVHNLVAMMAWGQAEGDAGRFNLLNCTERRPGSTDFNWVHVQNYVSYSDGVSATAHTLNVGANNNQYGYRAIRRRLQRNARAAEILKAVEDSAWGTGGLALTVLESAGWEALLTDRYLHHRLVQ